jgi:hypothetical protein
MTALLTDDPDARGCRLPAAFDSLPSSAFAMSRPVRVSVQQIAVALPACYLRRQLLTDEGLLDPAADVADSGVSRELLAHDQDLGRFAYVLLRESELQGETWEAPDEGPVRQDCLGKPLAGREHVEGRQS